MRSMTRLCAAVLAITVAATGYAAAGSGFGDVEPGAYYEKPVTWLVENDITTGVEPGCFAPDEYVTRGQVAAFLYRLDQSLGGVPVGAGHPYIDVTKTYQQAPVSWMHDRGITTGTSDTTFSPSDPVSRGEFAAFLWRYAGSPRMTTHHPFTDVLRFWQDQPISWMAGTGITTGTSATTFSPELPMTRGQVAAFMWRFAGSPDVVGSGTDGSCARALVSALEAGGLTAPEAACASGFLVDFSISELEAAFDGSTFPSYELLAAVSDAANECLTPDRIVTLSQLLF